MSLILLMTFKQTPSIYGNFNSIKLEGDLQLIVNVIS